MQALEVVEVVLIQCNLVDNQYQQVFKVLFTFTSNKSYAYLLNVEPSNVLFFVKHIRLILIKFTDQNSIPLEIGNKFNLTVLINK